MLIIIFTKLHTILATIEHNNSIAYHDECDLICFQCESFPLYSRQESTRMLPKIGGEWGQQRLALVDIGQHWGRHKPNSVYLHCLILLLDYPYHYCHCCWLCFQLLIMNTRVKRLSTKDQCGSETASSGALLPLDHYYYYYWWLDLPFIYHNKHHLNLFLNMSFDYGIEWKLGVQWKTNYRSNEN